MTTSTNNEILGNRTVLLKNVRTGYLVLYTPQQYLNSGPARYSAQLLVEKGSEHDKQIREAIEQISTEVHGAKSAKYLASIQTNGQKYCYQDGDLKTNESYQGWWVLGANRREKQGPPLVLDTYNDTATGKLRRIPENEGKVYSGCYVNAKVNLWVQTDENPGIRATIEAVQFSKDGDAFTPGAARPSDEGFEELSVESDDLS